MAEATPSPIKLVEDSKLLELFPELEQSELDSINSDILALIEEYCNTTLSVIDYTNEICDDRLEFSLRHMPIVSVTSISTIDTDNLETILTAYIDYQVYPNKIVRVSPTGIRHGLIVDYSAGFSIIPQSFYTVALDLARFRKFKETEGSMLFYKTQVFDEREYQVDPTMSENKILSRLKKYRQKSKSDNGGGSIRVGVM